MTEPRPGRIMPWALAGTLALALLLGLVWRFGQPPNPAQALASKATRADLANRIQVAIASAAEAEKSAVLAATDEASQAFAAQARAATAEAERARTELGRLLAQDGTPRERELLEQLGRAFGDLQAVEAELLGLAGRNTNLKAHALAIGPAAKALADLDAALERLGARPAPPASAAERRRLADRARIGILRIQVLLEPHILEASDAEMDRLEGIMAGEVQQVRRALDGLAAAAGPGARAEVAEARAALDRYLAVRDQVLALSRENTNVKSLALSLGRGRAALAVCLEALAALQQAILAEPIPGISYGGPVPTR